MGERTAGGGFFILARVGKNISQLIPKKYLFAKNAAAPGGVARQDWALCQWMAEEVGLLCLPSSPFFSKDRIQRGVSDSFIRVAFCKTDQTINDAARALRRLKLFEPILDEKYMASSEQERRSSIRSTRSSFCTMSEQERRSSIRSTRSSFCTTAFDEQYLTSPEQDIQVPLRIQCTG